MVTGHRLLSRQVRICCSLSRNGSLDSLNARLLTVSPVPEVREQLKAKERELAEYRTQITGELWSLFSTLAYLVVCGGKTCEYFDFWLSSSSKSAWEEGRHLQRCSNWGRRWAVFDIGSSAAVIMSESGHNLLLVLIHWFIIHPFQGCVNSSGQEWSSSSRIRNRLNVSHHWGLFLTTRTCSQRLKTGVVFFPFLFQLFSISSTRWRHIVQSLRKNLKVIKKLTWDTNENTKKKDLIWLNYEILWHNMKMSCHLSST